MNMVREALRGRKAKLEDDIRRWRLRCDGEQRQLHQVTSPGLIAVEDLDMARIMDVAQQLAEYWAELNKAMADLEMVNAELDE
jgi:hypothetical protein